MDVLEVMKDNPKICNYLDIPLQHISDSVLKSMRRGTTEEKTNKLLDLIKKSVPEIAIRTTLIVGYPGETKKDFELLKSWVKKTRFDRLGCFAYSHEENTHAYNLDDNIPKVVKQQRVNEIMEIQSQISWELNQEKIGSKYKVVVDRKSGNYYIGRTEHDSPDVDNEVFINAQNIYLKIGEYVNVVIDEASDFDLYASVID